MKFYFEQPNFPWQPERYRYAAEQMMLTLFPGERPEYPEEPPRTMEDTESAAWFALSREGDEAVLTARVVREGKEARNAFPFPAGAMTDLEGAPLEEPRTPQMGFFMQLPQPVPPHSILRRAVDLSAK